MRDYYKRKDAITNEVAIKRTFDAHGDKIALLEFKGSHGKSLFECKICNNKWNADTWSVWRGNGCPECRNRILSERYSFKFEDVKEYIESKNCKLLSTEYKNGKIPLIIQFECGHIGERTTFESFKDGKRCRICGLEKSKVSRKYSTERINKIMEDNNLIFIDFPDEYINRNSKIKYTCNYNHINYVAFSSFLKWHKCFTCSRIDLLERVSGVNASNWQGGLTEVKTYLAKRITNWEKKCKEQSNSKCVITGKDYDDIHHLYSFNLILKESIEELNFELKETIGEYKKEDLKLLINRIREKHKKYPLGVCLTRDWHMKFHNIYGYGDTTPEMWYEFLEKIKSGDIKG